jgi:hypothetical protein
MYGYASQMVLRRCEPDHPASCPASGGDAEVDLLPAMAECISWLVRLAESE